MDIHLHDGGEVGASQVRMIAERTRALGLSGNVSISHAFCLGMVDDVELGRLVELLVENRISIMSNAPGDRPMPLRRLCEAGVTVFSGSDGVRDAWTPFGTADMLERAMLLAYRNGFRTDELLHSTLDIVTRGGATVLGLQGYGLDGWMPRRLRRHSRRDARRAGGGAADPGVGGERRARHRPGRALHALSDYSTERTRPPSTRIVVPVM